jgi:hypothetical protein
MSAGEHSQTWHTQCIALNERGSMFRIETNQLASQDDLPPEILRRLQVEELWARRNVLAELMNADRLQVYAQRRIDLAAGCAPMDVGSRTKEIRLAATVVPMRNRKSFGPVAL